MTTVLADRHVFGVIVPSTNTAVEDEYYRFRAPGVGFHPGRLRLRGGGRIPVGDVPQPLGERVAEGDVAAPGHGRRPRRRLRRGFRAGENHC